MSAWQDHPTGADYAQASADRAAASAGNVAAELVTLRELVIGLDERLGRLERIVLALGAVMHSHDRPAAPLVCSCALSGPADCPFHGDV